MAEPVYDPHAEKEFGRFNYAVGKYVPKRMREVVRLGAQLRALPATTNKKAKG